MEAKIWTAAVSAATMSVDIIWYLETGANFGDFPRGPCSSITRYASTIVSVVFWYVE